MLKNLAIVTGTCKMQFLKIHINTMVLATRHLNIFKTYIKYIEDLFC
jgi:hypothetical protein